MIRTTLSSNLFRGVATAVVAALALTALYGCEGGDYRHQALGTGVAEASEVESTLNEIRRFELAELDRAVATFGAPNLPDDRRQALQALFAEFAKADAVDLIDLDKFGTQVYRAAFSLTTGINTREIYVLLVKLDGKLYWAGMN